MEKLAAVVGESLRINSSALAKGVLVVEFDWPLDGTPVSLRAVYPDSFPRFRPSVSLRDPATFRKRHCSPLDGNLCLLGRETRQWRHKWTLTKLLQRQLKDSLQDTGVQDPQGEPTEYWWNLLRLNGSYCLIDSGWDLNAPTRGTLKINYSFERKASGPEIRALVSEIRDQHGAVLHTWTSPIPNMIVSRKAVVIPWVYIDDFILPNGTSKQIDNFVERLLPQKPWLESFDSSISAKWFAVLHKSELGPGLEGLGWAFIFIHGEKKCFQPPKHGKQPTFPRLSTIPTYRAGSADLGARVPATKVLRNKKIVVVGAGAIGAPTAIELARNGCRQLDIVDHDLLEPGNSVRWSLGATGWGKPKAEILANFIRQEYPWTDVKEHLHNIGTQSASFDKGDESLFLAILPDTDLVVDATASYGVSTLLGDYCRRANLPLISFYASPPLTGGAVARFWPKSGCPTCLEIAYDTEVLNRAPGFHSEEGMQQPPGCAELTFTGASYDLQELSLQAVRVVIDTLREEETERRSDVYTLSLGAHAHPPEWRTDQLPKMDSCSCQTTS
ncbi:MAG: ThiF family adenylyltransferase [Pseudolabrys sp.]|nr:ThiF family adenylyltransferase [Pseudolabrys sp.]MDP2296136.1 ThiF family adenylyltransferase [Pseudolabrys sp.]